MSGNKLLAENTIRRFMKLASVDTMTDNFIAEQGMKYKDEDLYKEEDVQEEENINEEEEDLEIDAEPEEEEEMADLEPESEIAPEEDMGAADMSLTEEEAQLLIDLGKRLEEAMGGEMDAEDPVMDAEPAAEPAMDEPDIGAEEEEDEEEPMMQEALVNEVLKRVTKRIVAAKLKNRK